MLGVRDRLELELAIDGAHGRVEPERHLLAGSLQLPLARSGVGDGTSGVAFIGSPPC
jgi:hypothetical protein